MKKIWLYAAAIAAMTACSEAAVEEITPEVGGELVTITATAGADSRVAVDHEDWSATWETGDAMAAINTENGNYNTVKEFTLTSGENTAVGSFTGTSNGTCYFVYPYSAADVRRGDLLIDITQQTEGMTNCFMYAEDIDTSANPTMTMQHATGVYELNMTFSSGFGCDNYTIDRVEVIGLYGKLAIVKSGSIGGNIKLPITITDGETTVASSKATIRFNALDCTTKSLTVVAYLSNGGTKKTAIKTLTASEEVDFAAGEHHTINCGNMVKLETWRGHAASDITDGDISSAEDLAKLANMVNFNGVSDGYDGKTFTLTQDIDLSEYEWEAIGDSTHKFKGTFDGGGHKITGLYINQPDEQYQGLFGGIEGATIKDLTVSGYVVSENYVGGVVGHAKNTTIENCHNLCTVRGNKDGYVGGVVGFIISDTSKLTDCSNSGDVTGCFSIKVGGVVGMAVCPILNCYNLGAVTNSKNDQPNYIFVGGVVGHAYKNVENSYNRGYVANSANSTSRVCVGGIVGYASTDATINNCYNSGIVTNSGSGGTDTYVGGIAGSAHIDGSCYYQDNTAQNGGNSVNGGGATKCSEVELTNGSILNHLNNNRGTNREWESDTANDNYPKFK